MKNIRPFLKNSAVLLISHRYAVFPSTQQDHLDGGRLALNSLHGWKTSEYTEITVYADKRAACRWIRRMNRIQLADRTRLAVRTQRINRTQRKDRDKASGRNPLQSPEGEKR